MKTPKKRYEVKLNLGKDLNGNLVRKSFYSTRSKAAARKKAEEFRVRYEMELCVAGSGCMKNKKFAEWAPYALETYKKPFVKGNTYAGTYRAPLDNHLLPYFGKMYMDDIKPLHVQRFINEATKVHGFETIAKDVNCLRLIFDTAVDNQLCTKSPLTKSIKLPKRETTSGKKVFTQEQYDIAYAFAKEWEGGLPIMVLLELGISRSELLGLCHEDLDREKRCLHINQGLVVYHSDDSDKQVMESDGLKNQFRRRSIPVVDDDLWDRLCKIPKTVHVGDKTVLTKQMFHSPEGKPYNPNNWVNRVYRPFMRALHQAHPDIPELSPHECRHTRATLWIAQGIDPYMVARLMGHNGLAMLVRRYDHTSVDTLRNVLYAANEKETASS